MGIIKDFIEYRKVMKLLEKVENKDKEEEAKKELVNIINEYPEMAKEVFENAARSEEVPNEVLSDAVTEIIENSEEKNGMIAGVKVMAKIGEEVPDEYLKKVVDAASNSEFIDRASEVEVLKQVDDTKIKQKQVADIMRRIYGKMNINTTDTYLETELEKLGDIVNSSKSINDWKRNIVAKKIAYNYMKHGSTQLYALNKIVPLNEMFMINMPEKVQNEYNSIIKKEVKNNNKNTYKEYNKQDFKYTLLNEMARNIAYKYEKTGELIIPQSQQMKKIEPDEEKFFIEKISNYSDKRLDDKQINMVKGRIRGNIDEMAKLEEIITMIKKRPEDQRSEIIGQMQEITQNKKMRDIYSVIKKTKIDETFQNMNKEEIEKSFNVFKNTIDKQINKKIDKQNEKTKVVEQQANKEDDGR